MDPRRIFLAVSATLVLGTAMSASTLAAAPTFSGVLTCTDAVTGEVRELDSLTNATRHDIAVHRRFWAESGFCAKGSFDTTDLTQDP